MDLTYANKGFTFLFLLFTATFSFAQVGVGTITPDGALDLNSDSGTNSYGLVLPRVALTRTDSASPIVDPNTGNPIAALNVGTVVYNTATTNFGRESVYPGIYMWDGDEWINEFPKKHAEIFEQNSNITLRTVTTGGYQDIAALTAQTFTPRYTGTYKVEVSVNWGSGTVEDLGPGINIAAQKGNFKFTFDGVDRLIPLQTWSAKFGGGTVYFLIWEQATVIYYLDLVANTNYNFSLSFDQTISDGFIDGGDANDGRGWLGYDIPCTVEFVYID